jgi:hypothetical protein
MAEAIEACRPRMWLPRTLSSSITHGAFIMRRCAMSCHYVAALIFRHCREDRLSARFGLS